MANPAIQAVTSTLGQILYSGVVAATTPTTLYTVGASSTVKLATGTVCNTSGTARTVADGVLNTTTTVTSATANFTAADVGKTITGTGIPASTTIASVTNATTIVLSTAATATATGVALSWVRTAAPVTVSVSLHQSGSVADGTHQVVSGYSLAAGDTLSLRDYIGGAMLGAGDYINITAGTANTVTAVLTGAVST